ncbi:hypothetical protein IFM89_012629 [Coptis chinensis]|uniref:Uncharacterized protein n=1 Tax=Coptis chinensis TaxID=261450 RepID=A0A835M8M2_9MAGN|nr:hypothetical protein IFM89_012629 [Coptis chinensis]
MVKERIEERGRESLVHPDNSIAEPPNLVYVPPHRRNVVSPNLVYVPPNRRSTATPNILFVVPSNRRSNAALNRLSIVVPPNQRSNAAPNMLSVMPSNRKSPAALNRNYLPREVFLTIESGGIARTVMMSEVNCASIFHIDSTHDLGLVFHVNGFRPSASKFPRAEAFAAVARFHENKFSLSETLTFYFEICLGRIELGLYF